MKLATLCIIQSLLTGVFVTSCSSPPSISVEDLIMADAFGVTLPSQNQAAEIRQLRAEVSALKEAK